MKNSESDALWKPAPLIKIYEALGTLGDGRYEVGDNFVRVYSSSGNKSYEVNYDPQANAIMANDNGSYWQRYLGYPSIVLLLALDIVPYDPQLCEFLKGIAWKDINQQFNNDFAKTQAYVDTEIMLKHGVSADRLHQKLTAVQTGVNALGLRKLGSRKKPPTGY